MFLMPQRDREREREREGEAVVGARARASAMADAGPRGAVEAEVKGQRVRERAMARGNQQTERERVGGVGREGRSLEQALAAIR